MAGSSLDYLGITELSELIAARRLSPVELIEAHIARIERLDPRLKAFARFSPEDALAHAVVLEQELAAGHIRGPLHGIPLALKDLFWHKGKRTAAGTVIHRDFQPPLDATVVGRLREAGANLIGSAQMTEGAFANHLPPVEPPVNPWRADHWPGASSSGSGVAVAAGLVPGSLGTETGGSIHLPSAVNGVTGLKPTWGRVSRFGVFELAATLDTVGPMARSAEDAAVLLGVIAGPDPQDATAARVAVPDYRAGLEPGPLDIRIGLDQDYAFAGTDEVTVAAVTAAIEVLGTLGAEIVDIRFPDVTDMVADWFPVTAVQAAVAHEATFPARRAEYGADLADLIDRGRALSGMDYQRLILRRLDFRGRVEALFDEVDLIVLPVLGISDTTSSRMAHLDDDLITAVHKFTCPFTMSGNPALTLPCGLTEANTPVAFQFVGRHFDERLVLRAGHAFQSVTDWHRRRPLP
ncbi:amidase [Amycolatopsis pigmentata]|uniref:Amidase n=1 Tax=Amycolatopsis pigmentata TaxID=450801 RepID=A0ABW5FNP1_9PSEU